MATNRETELETYGCKSPEWFLRDHIPRYAEHYGVSMTLAYQAVLEEIVALDEVRNQNFRQMIDAGTAQRMLQIYAKRGQIGQVGERPLIILDNYTYMMKREVHDNPQSDWIYYDPGRPLAISNFHTMEDPIPVKHVDSITIGRPNTDGELWLSDGIAVEDYDVVKDCFNRLLALRENGITPHMSSFMDHIFIPYTLGNTETPFDPSDYSHDPVDYHSTTSELKVAT